MNVPENLKFTKDHEWVKVDGNIATVGITDYAQGELGEIVFVDVQTEGETLDKEETAARLGGLKDKNFIVEAMSASV